jgi:hypothetical protein
LLEAEELLLSRQELIELTGYRRPSAMKRWLLVEGVKFLVGADGWPKVHHNELESILVKTPKRRQSATPDATSLVKWQSGG